MKLVFTSCMIRYEMPRDWIAYDRQTIMDELIGAKSAMMALTGIPYQRSWADELQKIQLKREVAGTSRFWMWMTSRWQS